MFRTETINQPGSHRSIVLGVMLAAALAVVAVAGFVLVKDAVGPGTAASTTVSPGSVSNSIDSEYLRELSRGWYAGSTAPDPAVTDAANSEYLRETWRGQYSGSSTGAQGPGSVSNSIDSEYLRELSRGW